MFYIVFLTFRSEKFSISSMASNYTNWYRQRIVSSKRKFSYGDGHFRDDQPGVYGQLDIYG